MSTSISFTRPCHANNESTSCQVLFLADVERSTEVVACFLKSLRSKRELPSALSQCHRLHAMIDIVMQLVAAQSMVQSGTRGRDIKPTPIF